jgi:hypothetical protein
MTDKPAKILPANRLRVIGYKESQGIVIGKVFDEDGKRKSEEAAEFGLGLSDQRLQRKPA